MKLTLGTTELADIPDDVAQQLLGLFQTPGHLSAMPHVGPIQKPESHVARLNGSHLAHSIERNRVTVTFELTATSELRGPLFDTRDRERAR